MLETKAQLGRWMASPAGLEYIHEMWAANDVEPSERYKDDADDGIHGWLKGYEGRLAKATTYWVTRSMTHLAAKAAETMPPGADVLPLALNGFVFFDGSVLAPTDAHHINDLRGLHWDSGNAVVPFFALNGRIVFGLPAGLTEEPGQYEFDSIDVERRFLASLTKSCWALMAQRIAVTERIRPDRPALRRLQRMGAPESSVVVIALRKQAGRPSDTPGENHVEWSHRWLVDGHWRNQWVSETVGHRLTWISPYIKGPEEKPLVVKDKVYRWQR